MLDNQQNNEKYEEKINCILPKEKKMVSHSSSLTSDGEEEIFAIIEQRIIEEVNKTGIEIINPKENCEENYIDYVEVCLSEIKKIKNVDFEPMIKHKETFINQENKEAKILLLDLDETLIHSDFDGKYESLNDYDTKIKFKLNENDKIIKVGVYIRPGAREFIKEISNYFEIGVFTASLPEYANEIIKILDPENKYIKFKFFKKDCLKANEFFYIKDLSIFSNIDLKNIILLDNSIYSFTKNLSNGILISSFYNDKEDQKLDTIFTYLIDFIYPSDNVRIINENTFHFQEFYENF